MLVFQHFQLPVHFIQDKNGGSKVKVAYCYLVVYELNNMSVFDYHPTDGRWFLATKTKVKVKWKTDMDNYLNISSLVAFEDSTWPLPKPIKIFCLNPSSTSLKICVIL